MIHIETRDAFYKVSKGSQVIFLFSADWCPDCIVIEPELPLIEDEFPDYEFYYVDRDKHLELCQELDVFGIPSFLAYKEGYEVGRLVSKERKSKEQIIEFIEGCKVKTEKR